MRDVMQGRTGRRVEAHRCSTLATDVTLEADVVIIGSGAGGGVAVELLTAAGLRSFWSRKDRY